MIGLSLAIPWVACRGGGTANPIGSPELHFDASDLSTMRQERDGEDSATAAAVDAVVGSWHNKGTLGGWATAPADANRPTLRSSGGLYWLEFDGSSDYFVLENSFQAGATSMIAAAFTRASAGIISNPTGTQAVPHRSYGVNWYTDNVQYFSLGSSVERAGPTSTSTGTFVTAVTHSSASTQLRRNASELDTFSDVDSAQATTQIGRHGSTDYHAGKLYGIIAAQSVANLAAIETFLGAKAGLVL
jgi:hypothetical protein